MKKSKKIDLRELSREQLTNKLKEAEEQMLRLEGKFRTGSGRLAFVDTGQPPLFKKTRRTIAIIKTILKERRK